MPFFLPRELVELEYLGGQPTNDEEAKQYRFDTDFAFFVVNFHMSRADYESLTQREKAFIRKAYENKVVFETTMIDNAVNNAVANALRKKGRSAAPLWKKKPKRADNEKLRAELKKGSKEIDKSWVEKIYAANGNLKRLTKLRKDRNNG